MKRALILLPVALLASACPKKAATHVAGSDDEQVEQLSAQLEEMRSRLQAQELSCPDRCAMAKKVCHISDRTCEIAGRNADRPDMEKRCIGSREDCATFNDACAGCR